MNIDREIEREIERERQRAILGYISNARKWRHTEGEGE